MERGQVWEWLGFDERDGIRVTLLVLDVVASRGAWCVTLDSSREGVWPSGEVGVWGASHSNQYRRIA